MKMEDNLDELFCKTRIKLTPDFFGKMFLSKVSLKKKPQNQIKIQKNWKKKVKLLKNQDAQMVNQNIFQWKVKI